MIPTIGIMIGAYIFTRMVELVASSNTGIAVKFFAVITIIVDLIGVTSLLLSSVRSPSMPL